MINIKSSILRGLKRINNKPPRLYTSLINSISHLPFCEDFTAKETDSLPCLIRRFFRVTQEKINNRATYQPIYRISLNKRCLAIPNLIYF